MANTKTETDTPAEKKAAADSLGDTGGAVKPNETQPNTSTTSVQNSEPEDAYLTGGQRNLQRRVLGLNVEGDQHQRPVDQSPGLHTNGSFTGTANEQTGPEPGSKGK